jgi:hypothetical protein
MRRYAAAPGGLARSRHADGAYALVRLSWSPDCPVWRGVPTLHAPASTAGVRRPVHGGCREGAMRQRPSGAQRLPTSALVADVFPMPARCQLVPLPPCRSRGLPRGGATAAPGAPGSWRGAGSAPPRWPPAHAWSVRTCPHRPVRRRVGAWDMPAPARARGGASATAMPCRTSAAGSVG